MTRSTFMRLRSADRSYVIGIQVSDAVAVVHFDGPTRQLVQQELAVVPGADDLQTLRKFLQEVLSQGSWGDDAVTSSVGEFAWIDLPDKAVQRLLSQLHHPSTDRSASVTWAAINDVLTRYAARLIAASEPDDEWALDLAQ